MAVLQLVRSNNRETVEALQYLLHEAERGDLNAINATFRRRDGDEEALRTGIYKASPEMALMALLRLSVLLLRAEQDAQ